MGWAGLRFIACGLSVFTQWWWRTYFGWGQHVLDSGCPQLHSAWPFHCSLWYFCLSLSRAGRPGLSPRCHGTLAHNTASTQTEIRMSYHHTTGQLGQLKHLLVQDVCLCSSYLKGESNVDCYWSCYSSKAKECSRVAVKNKTQNSLSWTVGLMFPSKTEQYSCDQCCSLLLRATHFYRFAGWMSLGHP